MNDNRASATTLGDMLPVNPMGAALVGAGLLWLFAGAKTTEVAIGAVRAASDAIPTGARSLATPQTLRTAVDSARDTMGRVFVSQPLLLAVGGFAVGAAIAASLPTSTVETRTFGDAADELKRRAGAFVTQATEAAHETVSAAQGQAKEAFSTAEHHAREAGKEAGLI